MSAESDAIVRSSWEGHGKPVTYTVTIVDHGQVYGFAVEAVDIQYALASVLIENKLYLTSASQIEIQELE